MKRWVLGGLALTVALIAVVVVRAASMRSHQIAVEPIEPVPVDAVGAVERLRGGLRIRTISEPEGTARNDAAFARFRDYLEEQFPLVHTRLDREVVAGHSLLFRWAAPDGGAPTGDTVVLLAHQDVVPIDPGTEGDWTHPPFDAAEVDGYVWGRGSLDDKASLFAILEAVEGLLADGFAPRRDVYLAFGHDEELGGAEGAESMAALLAERDVPVGLVLDEGGAVLDGSLPGLTAPVAAIGVAEKGYISLVLEVEGGGGHSSAPPPESAIGRLAAAVVRVEGAPFETRFVPPVRAFFERGIGPESPFAYRLLYANLWLFEPVARAGLARVPGANAMLRTTTAPTIFEAGRKDNVLPARARAVVNFRVLPGDSTDDVVEHVRAVVGDDGVRVRALPKRREPSTTSSLDGSAWQTLARTVREVFPGTTVAPYLMVAGTDSRHFRALCDCVYQFMPFRLAPADLKRAHGTDERIPTSQVPRAVRFYRRLVENAAG